MKSKYDQKLAKHNKSADSLRLRRLRRIVIVAWLCASIAVGIFVYNGYAKRHMSNTPMMPVSVDTGVSTGTTLLENTDFGPWNGNFFDNEE